MDIAIWVLLICCEHMSTPSRFLIWPFESVREEERVNRDAQTVGSPLCDLMHSGQTECAEQTTCSLESVAKNQFNQWISIAKSRFLTLISTVTLCSAFLTGTFLFSKRMWGCVCTDSLIMVEEVKVIIKCGWSLQRESQLPPSSQVTLFLLPALHTGCTTFSLNLLQLHVVNLCLLHLFISNSMQMKLDLQLINHDRIWCQFLWL